MGFITALYSTDPFVVAPNPYQSRTQEEVSFSEVQAKCNKIDNNAKVSTIDELNSMTYNKFLLGLKQDIYWSNNSLSSTEAWFISFDLGRRARAHKKTNITYGV